MRYKDTVSEIMLDSMSLSMDCVLNGQSREEKYNELEKILKTKVHYEKSPADLWFRTEPKIRQNFSERSEAVSVFNRFF